MLQHGQVKCRPWRFDALPACLPQYFALQTCQHRPSVICPHRVPLLPCTVSADQIVCGGQCCKGSCYKADPTSTETCCPDSSEWAGSASQCGWSGGTAQLTPALHIAPGLAACYHGVRFSALLAGDVYTTADGLKQTCCKQNQYGYTDGEGNPQCCSYGGCSQWVLACFWHGADPGPPGSGWHSVLMHCLRRYAGWGSSQPNAVRSPQFAP